MHSEDWQRVDIELTPGFDVLSICCLLPAVLYTLICWCIWEHIPTNRSCVEQFELFQMHPCQSLWVDRNVIIRLYGIIDLVRGRSIDRCNNHYLLEKSQPLPACNTLSPWIFSSPRKWRKKEGKRFDSILFIRSMLYVTFSKCIQNELY